MNHETLKILLIEDNPADRELIREMVDECGPGCELRFADRLSAGLDLLSRERFDAVFLDLGLPDSSGVASLQNLQDTFPDVAVIVLTGLADRDLASRAISLGAQDYLTKGRIDVDVLMRSALYARERKRNEVAMREQKELSEELNRLADLIHSTLDLETVLRGVAAGAARAIRAEAAAIGLFREERYEIKAVYNLPADQVGRSVAAREVKGILHSASIRDVEAFNEAPSDPRLNRDLVRAAGIRSLMVAPFLARGSVLGALSFYAFENAFVFSEAHVDFARKLSFSVSTALENARLYEALKESEHLSRARLMQLQAVYASAPVGLCFVDAALRLRNSNERFADLIGSPLEQNAGRTIRDVMPGPLADIMEPYYRSVIETGLPVENVEVSGGPDSDGRTRCWLTGYYPVRDAGGRLLGVNSVVQEITARKRMEEEIRHLANHDALTGLPNRRLFIELIGQSIAEARRRGAKLAVFFLDLDRFKNINDTLGHEAGDELLREVARGLKRTVRSSDTVARIGGDEFNIIVPDISRTEDIADVARKIVEYFSRTFRAAGQEFHITASLGISVFPDDSREIETLLRYADIAMYHAKEKGRNTYRFYNPEINNRSLERMLLEHWLSRSVERNELFIQYQPQVDLRSGKVVCAEALVRWRHPEAGVMAPARFIPVAEETGFITVIDEWVLWSVCRQARAWLDAGLPSACVTVNVSARLFEDPDLVRTVGRVLRETGVPPACLDLEITETMAMSNVERTAARLKELTAMGVTISIDDFGTGYSSLNYLKRLPIGRLKIDQSFVRDITTDADDRSIITAVTSMAHTMKMRVLAEGVETEDQLEFLKAAGCDEMQGFLFSRPLPPAGMAELISKN